MNESPETLSGEAGRLLGAAPLLACFDFQEHPGWRANPDKTIGATRDGWCSRCGFRIENARFDSGKGHGISGNGRRLASCVSRRIIDGVIYTSETSKIYCSACVPSLLGNARD